MPDYTDEYIITTIHDFKTNFSKYLKMLEKEHYRAVIVKRYNKRVGIFVPHDIRMREAVSEMETYS